MLLLLLLVQSWVVLLMLLLLPLHGSSMSSRLPGRVLNPLLIYCWQLNKLCIELGD
jgi:hypothetical protein